MCLDASGPIFYANINVSAIGDTTLAAGLAGYQWRILGLSLVASAAVTVTLKSGAATNLIGPVTLVAGVEFLEPTSGLGYQQAGLAENLVLNLSAAVQVGGQIAYQRIDRQT